MKQDDFEKQLQRRPLRPVPAEWRDEILRAAASPHASRITRHVSCWRELLWPNPAAWAGLAAVWVAIIALNLSSSQKPLYSAVTPAPSSEMLQALNQQKQLFAELIRSGDLPPMEPPKPFVPRPRSEHAPAIATV